jgi:tRNA-uridine 2-sulfurtransferase
MKKKKIVVGMSGGVDSSVSAYLLKKQGMDVIGLFMKNWEEDAHCPASRDFEDVAAVCKKLDIPYYAVNFTQEYKDSVFQDFLEEYRAGYTPNPDVLCNREIKFKVFLEKAKDLDADFLATGHYARIDPDFRLIKGNDPEKDQTYFLHSLSKEILKKILFPIGHLPKSEVRKIAREADLPTSEKKDSTGICFIGERKFTPFLQNYLGTTPGNFENLEGKILGRHDGLSFYTIGQRKGIKLGGAKKPYYVVGKDLCRNIVFIEQGNDHPSLFSKELFAEKLSWIDTPPSTPFSCRAKIRHRQEDQECEILSLSNNNAHVRFSSSQRAVAPGQFIVFYDHDICLGGGRICASSQ